MNEVVREVRDIFGNESGAVFSPEQAYRYRLWRQWDPSLPWCLFIMLNPSTADERVLDPTVRKCVGYSKRWGYGGLMVGNIFAYRSTDPRGLYTFSEPVGPSNDRHLAEMTRLAAVVVCAWGNHGVYRDRGAAVMQMLRAHYAGMFPTMVACLGVTKTEQPRHPLYLPDHTPRIPYTTEAA